MTGEEVALMILRIVARHEEESQPSGYVNINQRIQEEGVRHIAEVKDGFKHLSETGWAEVSPRWTRIKTGHSSFNRSQPISTFDDTPLSARLTAPGRLHLADLDHAERQRTLSLKEHQHFDEGMELARVSTRAAVDSAKAAVDSAKAAERSDARATIAEKGAKRARTFAIIASIAAAIVSGIKIVEAFQNKASHSNESSNQSDHDAAADAALGIGDSLGGSSVGSLPSDTTK